MVVPVGKMTYADDQNKHSSMADVDVKVLKSMGIGKEDVEKYGGQKDE